MNNAALARFSLAGRVALVTGVSRGLGQAIAVGLAEAGADIVGVSISDASETKQKIERLSRQCHLVQADLSRPGEALEAAKRAAAFVGHIDILVNNAGIIRRAPAESFTDEDWEQVFEVNVHSIYQLSRFFGKRMLDSGAGSIINIASMLSFQGGKNVIAYTTSKHAVAGMTRALANEWSRRGVRVNAIAPGYMVTDNTAPLREDEGRASDIQARIPMGRWGTPDDLVGTAIFLASDASSYVNGHVLCVDGGWMSS